MLQRRMRLAAILAAQQSADSSKALQLLKELPEQVADGSEEDKMLVQLMMGDVQYKVGCTPVLLLRTDMLAHEHKHLAVGEETATAASVTTC